MPVSKPEPNFQTACEWWPDLPNIWTPVGWKNHLFRFSVFWCGMLLAQPDLNGRTEKYRGQGMQALFFPTPDGTNRSSSFLQDDNMVRQGWATGAAPVLWTEWAQDGVVMRQYIFAHVPGGQDVQTGIEPLFAWVRMVIHDVVEALPPDPEYGFGVRLNAPHLATSMQARSNVIFNPARGKYPRLLTPDAPACSPRRAWRLIEPDGRVRLGLPAGQACPITFKQPGEANWGSRWGLAPDYELFVRMPWRKGAQVDLLIPMLPADRKSFDAELALGYDAALKQTARYWAKQPKTAARVQVPEPAVNDIIRHSLRFAEVLAEKDPETGKHCMIIGSFTYAALWATPGAMVAVMLLDLLGRHDVVARYAEIFREEQGTVMPPGPAYKQHPGYLSTPARYKSIDWLSDHGAILYMLAMHGLRSGDAEFVRRFTDAIVRACEWIQHACGLRWHGGVEGILPPAVATDKKTVIQAVWSIGWNYKGLTAAVRLLRQTGHPRAEEFARTAAQYRSTFREAYAAACRRAPTWTDTRGRLRTLPPTSLAGDLPEETRHQFYLDTGPLFLVFSGLLDADEEPMESVRLWFREGPPRRLYRFDGNFWQTACLHHEMSSSEPCYSWNVFHSWQQGDRERFLEGMYSLFAGSISRKTRTSCETRGGITGLVCAAPLPVLLARLAMIDDEIRDGELHLLRLAPTAWLGKGQETAFEKMPTFYGPVTLKTKVSKDGRMLDIVFIPKFRQQPKRIVLHVPPMPDLKSLMVNDKSMGIRGRKRIPLSTSG